MNGVRKIRHKWGFGMSPISDEMLKRYTEAIDEINAFVSYLKAPHQIELNSISEFKGMLNRCIKRDQWDWFTVHTKIGNPPIALMKKIVTNIIDIRNNIKNQEYILVNNLIPVLKNLMIERIIKNFHEKPIHSDFGWVYILSSREQNSFLKIGMTGRDLEKRVKEINSVTGVLFPLSVCSAFKVKNPITAEKIVFEELSEYRVRGDREFFEIPFFNAHEKIRNLLKEKDLLINDWV